MAQNFELGGRPPLTSEAIVVCPLEEEVTSIPTCNGGETEDQIANRWFSLNLPHHANGNTVAPARDESTISELVVARVRCGVLLKVLVHPCTVRAMDGFPIGVRTAQCLPHTEGVLGPRWLVDPLRLGREEG
jgi:hypothetical protein